MEGYYEKKISYQNDWEIEKNDKSWENEAKMPLQELVWKKRLMQPLLPMWNKKNSHEKIMLKNNLVISKLIPTYDVS